MPPATLQTVADAVGVSRSTVSNAYSRPDQLSAELRDKIFQAAHRLGYAGPNPTARSLRRGRAGAIGVLFTSALSYAFTDPYAVQFLRGLAQSAEQYQAGLLLIPMADDASDAATTTVLNAVVDGFCVYCVPDWHPALTAMQSRGVPVVDTNQRDTGPDAMYAAIDDEAAAYAAGAHLARLGHRDVAVIADWAVADRQTGPATLERPEDVPYHVSRERLRGYRRAFAEVGVQWSDIDVVNAAGNSRSAGAQAAAYLLDRVPRPTAIAALGDVLALGVLDALAARRLHPGRDISVVGFDDIPEADPAGLTTIRQPAVEKGRLAGQLLLDPPQLAEQRRLVLPTELIVRASSGPVPIRRN